MPVSSRFDNVKLRSCYYKSLIVGGSIVGGSIVGGGGSIVVLSPRFATIDPSVITRRVNCRGVNCRGVNCRGVNCRGVNCRGVNCRGTSNHYYDVSFLFVSSFFL